MSKLIYGDQKSVLNFGPGNHFLAQLQAATNRRFADGRGYFLTLTGHNDSGEVICGSHWIHPSIPLVFIYDTEDVTGEPPKTVKISDDQVNVLLEVMDRPLGVM
jgi:hypothetical protein